jgi:hypothetical protein
MKKVSFILILALLSNMLSAQFSMTSHKEALKIKNSTLLVSFEEEDPKKVSKLSKKKDKTKLKHYKDQIEGRNIALQGAVEHYWTFSDNVEYVTASEAKALMKANKDKYVKISYGKFLDYERYKTNTGQNGKPAGWSTGSDGFLTYNRSTKYTVLANVITTLEITDPKGMIKVYLPNVYASLSDAVYGIQGMQFILRYLAESPDHKIPKIQKYIRNNAGNLKDLTLLVDKNQVHKKLKESDIRKIYPYKFELVDGKAIDEAIIEKDKRYAYVTIVDTPGGKGNVSTHTITGAEDGKLYIYYTPSVPLTMKGTSFITYNERIKKKQFEKYANQVED